MLQTSRKNGIIFYFSIHLKGRMFLRGLGEIIVNASILNVTSNITGMGPQTAPNYDRAIAAGITTSVLFVGFVCSLRSK
jgi:hypothetical protein